MNKNLNILSLSGGKDSTALLFMCLEQGVHLDAVFFIDTGKEFPAMYDHIALVRQWLPKEIPFMSCKLDYDYWMFQHIKTRGKYMDTRGYGWPTSRVRWCTALKREALSALVRQLKTGGGKPIQFSKKEIIQRLLRWGNASNWHSRR